MRSIPIGPTFTVGTDIYYALPAKAVKLSWTGGTPQTGFGDGINGLGNNFFQGAQDSPCNAAFMMKSNGTITLSKIPPSKYADSVIKDGASNYWRLNEASGTIAKDIIGGADGTISGGVTLNQDGALVDNDKAMAFNGTTGKVVTAATIPITATIEAWMKASGTLTQHPIVANFVDPGKVYAGVNSEKAVYFGVSNTFGVKPINDGQWHHLVYVLGSGCSIYVDGQLDIFNAAEIRAAARTNPSIGEGAGGFWPGSLDEVAIYPLALTAQQIAKHYQNGKR